MFFYSTASIVGTLATAPFISSTISPSTIPSTTLLLSLRHHRHLPPGASQETQTPKDKWDVGPGQWANGADALAKGAVPGQVHFFPCIADAQQLKEQFEAKKCAKL